MCTNEMRSGSAAARKRAGAPSEGNAGFEDSQVVEAPGLADDFLSGGDLQHQIQQGVGQLVQGFALEQVSRRKIDPVGLEGGQGEGTY